jgi:hypothetical protein
MAADPNFTEQGSDEIVDPNTGIGLHLPIQGTLWLDWYAPKDNQSLSSLRAG